MSVGVDSRGLASTPFAITKGGGRFRLPAGHSHEVTLRFVPGSRGAYNAAFRVSGGGDSTLVLVNGTGAPGALTVLTPVPIDFGALKVRTRKTLALTIENMGPGLLHVEIDTKGKLGKPFSLAGARHFALAQNQSHTARITFAPASAHSFEGTITIISDDPSYGSVSIGVQGSGE